MARQNTILVWAVLLASLLVLLNLPTGASRRVKAALREALAPLHALVTRTSLGVREAGGALRGFGGMAGENRRLAEELARLRGEQRRLAVFGEQNRELRRQLGYRRASPRRLLPCEVIARDVSGWWQTLRIDRGTRDGVGPDMAVVTVDGLAGRTAAAAAGTADVLLVSDPNCRVAARIARTGANGIVSGLGVAWSGQVLCRMNFINRNLPVKAGDEVVTSGLGGVFPEGLPVGYVERAERDASGLYQWADVVPRAELGTMRYAFVLAGSGPEEPGPGAGGEDPP